MRITTSCFLALLTVPWLVVACSNNSTPDADPFDTLQDCYNEHHVTESLTVQQAIVVCCLDHPIAGVHPSCGDTQTACVTHVRAELDASVLDSDIEASCTTYISQK